MGKGGKRHEPVAASAARVAALKILLCVMRDGRSLETARDTVFDQAEAAARPQAMAIANSVLRWWFRLDALLQCLLAKPLRRKDIDIRLLLCMALAEIEYLSAPDYAVVNETVKICRQRRKDWAVKLVNGVLRNFLRRRDELDAALEGEGERLAYPGWLLDSLQHDWPDVWRAIAMAGNQRAPMWLRVNTTIVDTESYAIELGQRGLPAQPHPHTREALRLEKPLAVAELPGFNEGRVSVQDAGAQLCAGLLDVQPGDRVLDLCAAPGGKTGHLLERQPQQRLTAVDIDPERLRRVEEHLQRLRLDAQCTPADASDDAWSGPAQFDRILVDAPCSATGVIRRHPDIKILRRSEDIPRLVELQAAILENAWRMLKPGGTLLYVTCSVLRAENEQQIDRLLSHHADVVETPIDAAWGTACRHGRQLLPGEEDCDGFYYALLKKKD